MPRPARIASRGVRSRTSRPATLTVARGRLHRAEEHEEQLAVTLSGETADAEYLALGSVSETSASPRPASPVTSSAGSPTPRRRQWRIERLDLAPHHQRHRLILVDLG